MATVFRAARPRDELIRKYDVPGPRYTSYPTVPAWNSGFGPAEFAHQLEEAGHEDRNEPLSLYLHIPFCRKLCMYCGCNIVITRDSKRADAYLKRVSTELDLLASRLGDRRNLSQIQWGGGTPTFLTEPQIDQLWRAITTRFHVLPDAEVAIEVNPATTRNSQLTELRGLGFNRLSMGIQDFDPQVQHTINRVQSIEETSSLLQHARALGFSGINFDLIYGLPHQTPERWQRTIEAVLAMRPDRFAVYAFAYLPETLRHQRKLPVSAMPSGATKLDLLWAAHQAFSQAGYESIGMDHFALPEDELAKAQARRKLRRNFQGYTVSSAPDVIAVGVSAISDVHGAYAQNSRALPDYDRALDAHELATTRGFHLTPDDQRRRAVIESLMCNFWVDLGPDGESYFALELERLGPFQADGLVKVDGSQVQLLHWGRFFMRNVAMVFDAHLKSTSQPFSRTV
jgi:oxygen-independent coproporphyrinogen-3 oxidase